ncbi:uroporphyrinogen-III synthase [Bacillus timonensis]|uniref:Uroporphyrinogen-III synthase n=1 Tax=Bacillus timonensis TaxID=1033734 RepID=A0A4S3Q1G7_9BACI|nr:uroporphyrinogen-III synthase [Bacillus timonensis]THE15282.1 uroporphyrinogen-III synthase [Bacillus timonensis]
MESTQPLFGKTILNTRGKSAAAGFSKKILAAGGTPIEIPLLTFQKPKDTMIIEETIKNLHMYEWLIFTSKNGVDSFFEFYNLVVEKVTKNIPMPKIAVVGTKTEKALLAKGYTPELVPDEFIAEGLFESLRPYVKSGVHFLLARGNLSRSYLVDELTKHGAVATDLIVYETVGDSRERDQLIKLLKEKRIDIITFTSPSTVKQFYKMVEQTEWEEWTDHVLFACIGPETKKAADHLHIPIHICPRNYTTDFLLAEIIDFLHKKENNDGEITIC